jgi:hypothetical protein
MVAIWQWVKMVAIVATVAILAALVWLADRLIPGDAGDDVG